ncbi:MAG TPA: TetR/AcrR family transcriptional regulator, partial [Solirubrobacteraceae bacterium]|nr:TetR/AcrR family transcriptional regulator [Solirubrobacteraceae bacterium]
MKSTPDSDTAAPRRRGRPSSGGREAILDAALELLREEGVAKLTSREVAARAGVSDASVYYHFGDRPGLLLAVFAHGVPPLDFLVGEPDPEDLLELPELVDVALASLGRFFADLLPMMTAAQSDADLGRAMARHIEVTDAGPHKGVQALAGYLRREQAAGRVGADVDPEAAALLIIDTAFSRAARRLMLSL